MSFNHIALVGLGLIASSIALTIKSKKNSIKITGYSRTKTREEARKLIFVQYVIIMKTVSKKPI